jgi:hypothetical protein
MSLSGGMHLGSRSTVTPFPPIVGTLLCLSADWSQCGCQAEASGDHHNPNRTRIGRLPSTLASTSPLIQHTHTLKQALADSRRLSQTLRSSVESVPPRQPLISPQLRTAKSDRLPRRPPVIPHGDKPPSPCCFPSGSDVWEPPRLLLPDHAAEISDTAWPWGLAPSCLFRFGVQCSCRLVQKTRPCCC